MDLSWNLVTYEINIISDSCQLTNVDFGGHDLESAKKESWDECSKQFTNILITIEIIFIETYNSLNTTVLFWRCNFWMIDTNIVRLFSLVHLK